MPSPATKVADRFCCHRAALCLEHEGAGRSAALGRDRAAATLYVCVCHSEHTISNFNWDSCSSKEREQHCSPWPMNILVQYLYGSEGSTSVVEKFLHA